MQIVELANVILALSIEMLVDVTFAQLLKAISRKKMTWLGFYRVIVIKKLHCFIKPIHSRVSALTERLKDTDKK